MNFFRAFAILFWFVNALYLGCGGLTSLELAQNKEEIEKMVIDQTDTVSVDYDGKNFINVSAANIYKVEKEYDKKFALASRIFPLLNLPYSFLALIITAFAFGALGGTISIIKGVAIDNIPLERSKILSRPFLGGGSGIIILSISYILPLLLISGETEIRSLSIVFISLFGGLFPVEFFNWLSSVFGKIFKTS